MPVAVDAPKDGEKAVGGSCGGARGEMAVRRGLLGLCVVSRSRCRESGLVPVIWMGLSVEVVAAGDAGPVLGGFGVPCRCVMRMDAPLSRLGDIGECRMVAAVRPPVRLVRGVAWPLAAADGETLLPAELSDWSVGEFILKSNVPPADGGVTASRCPGSTCATAPLRLRMKSKELWLAPSIGLRVALAVSEPPRLYRATSMRDIVAACFTALLPMAAFRGEKLASG